MKFLRWALLLLLFVVVQACGPISYRGPSAAKRLGPRPYSGPSLAAKVRSKELHGCTGERFRIDLLEAITQLPDDTLDAQREQVRDWIFRATLSRSARGSDIGATYAGIIQQPLLRDDALAQVLHAQNGPTRSTTTKDGGVVMLLESADDETMAARQLEAIDEEALHIGTMPLSVETYQYVFKPETAYAEVCAMPTLSRSDIESVANRYRTATLSTPDQFQQFLANGADLLSARCTSRGLEVRGRLRSRVAKEPITIEHLAALSQTQSFEYVPPSLLGFSWDKVSSRQEIEAQVQQIDALREPIAGLPDEIQQVLDWKRKYPGTSTMDLFLSQMLQKQKSQSPGFSLDPHASPRRAVVVVDRFLGAMPSIPQFAAVFHDFNADADSLSVWSIPLGHQPEVFAEVGAALTSMREKLLLAADDQVEAILAEKRSGTMGGHIVKLVSDIVRRESTLQCARYDGPLQGTATGMTFFYTDLLMKVWALDWNNAAPELPIEGFRSQIHEIASTAQCSESDSTSTRYWLGVRESAFKRERMDVVRFAPIVTRVFAKSSNVGSQGEEFDSSAHETRFVSWWNDHYADVAAWEPQYELLNQLMKWSIVVSNARATKQNSCFAALDAVHVKRDHRLDQWMAAQRDLAWTGPIKLTAPFEDFATKVPSSECMGLLESQTFEFCQWPRSYSGGVSASSVRAILAKPIQFGRSVPNLARLGGNGVIREVESGIFQTERIVAAGGTLERVEIASAPTRAAFSAALKVEGVAASTVVLNNATPISRLQNFIERSGSFIRFAEQRNGLLTTELKMSDIARADIRIAMERGPLLEARLQAQSAANNMAVLSARLADAARGIQPTAGRLVELGEGRVAAQLTSPDKRIMVNLMESGVGSRGPPVANAQLSFTIGVDGANIPAAEGALVRAVPNVRVSIVSGDAAQSLLQRGIPIPTTESARVVNLGRALQEGQGTNVVRIVDDAILGGAKPAEFVSMQRQLAEQAIAIRRSAGDTTLLEQLNMRLALAARSQYAARASSTARAVVNADRAIVYAPANFPTGTQLPQAIQSITTSAPGNRYVLSVIDEISLTRAPESINVGGMNLLRVNAGRPVVSDYGAMGSFLRLLTGPTYEVLVVQKCSDSDPSLPPCH